MAVDAAGKGRLTTSDAEGRPVTFKFPRVTQPVHTTEAIVMVARDCQDPQWERPKRNGDPQPMTQILNICRIDCAQ